LQKGGSSLARALLDDKIKALLHSKQGIIRSFSGWGCVMLERLSESWFLR
jgi:hypothetical protein